LRAVVRSGSWMRSKLRIHDKIFSSFFMAVRLLFCGVSCSRVRSCKVQYSLEWGFFGIPIIFTSGLKKLLELNAEGVLADIAFAFYGSICGIYSRHTFHSFSFTICKESHARGLYCISIDACGRYFNFSLIDNKASRRRAT